MQRACLITVLYAVAEGVLRRRVQASPERHFDLARNQLVTWKVDALRAGFAQAVLGTLRLAPDGLLTLGPPCSSFVWVNSATSRRSRTAPYGDSKRAYVRMANLSLCFSWITRSGLPRIALRALMLVILATARGCYCVLEQPSSSVMGHLPEMVRTGKLIQEYLRCWCSLALHDPQNVG